MQVQKRPNILIQEVGPEYCLNCNQLIGPIQLLNHKTTCRGILNKDQKKLDQKLEQFTPNINQKTFEQLNYSLQYQQYPIQQQTQIQKQDVLTQVKQVFQANNPNAQQKEDYPKQEQRELKDDLKFYQNDLKDKHNMISQKPFESNKEQIVQGQQIITREAQNNNVQTQASVKEIKQPLTSFAEANRQQLNSGDPNLNSTKNQIKIQELNQIQDLKQVNQKHVAGKQQEVRNHLQNQQQIKIKYSSEEKKRENNQFKEANYFNNLQYLNQEQIQFNKNQKQQFLPHQQHFNNSPQNQIQNLNILNQDKNKKILIIVEQQNQIQNQTKSDYENQKLQDRQQQQQQQQQIQKQQQQQQFQKQSPLQQEKLKCQNTKIQYEESKNNQSNYQQVFFKENIPYKNKPQNQKDQLDQKIPQNYKMTNQLVQQQQQIKNTQYQQNNRRQVQNYQQQKGQNNNNKVRNRAISDFQVRNQFQYKPGIMITDSQVNQMTPEEIYEYFTQLELENQVGLKSKIFILESKRVQVNMSDNCVICFEEIQPQKEAVDIRLDCNHQFHYDCIRQWLLKSKYCPICKVYVDCATYQNVK